MHFERREIEENWELKAGDRLVIKLGGASGNELSAAIEDIRQLSEMGMKLVVVHGGSGRVNEVAEAMGHPSRHVTSPSGYSSRFTDEKTLEIFMMVTAGLINKQIVAQLQAEGVNALGLSGVDGTLLLGKRKEMIRVVEDDKTVILHGNYGGKVETVNTELLDLLMENGYVPVIAPLAISQEAEGLNIDADSVAAEIACSLQAKRLVILSNVSGLLTDVNDPETLISQIAADEVESVLDHAQGRMKLKVKAAAKLALTGFGQSVIADSRLDSPIFRALNGQGTTMRST